jgi:hypothetical protein
MAANNIMMHNCVALSGCGCPRHAGGKGYTKAPHGGTRALGSGYAGALCVCEWTTRRLGGARKAATAGASDERCARVSSSSLSSGTTVAQRP